MVWNLVLEGKKKKKEWENSKENHPHLLDRNNNDGFLQMSVFCVSRVVSSAAADGDEDKDDDFSMLSS